MSNALLLRAALSCSATTSQSEWQKRRLAPTYQPFLYLIDGGSNCREIRAEGISANASFTFSLLKSAISCPLAKKSHCRKWVLWAGAASATSTFLAVGPRVGLQGESPCLGHGGALQGMSLCSGTTDAFGKRARWGGGRFPSYHGGQLGNHVAQRVDVALIPRVGPAQVRGHLTELLLAGGSLVLRKKHTAQSAITAENTRNHRAGRGSWGANAL